jgi:GT2 family glycosyltransferase
LPGAEAIGRFNDRLLDTLGWWWDAPPTVPQSVPPSRLSEVQDGRQLITTTFGNRPSWFITDPRLSLLFPWWRQILLDHFVAVVIHRPAREAAWSLAVREGMSPELGLALWAAYHRHLAAGLNGLPVITVDYLALAGDPASVVASLAEALAPHGVALDRDASVAAVKPTLRRTTFPEASRPGSWDQDLIATVDQVWPTAPVQAFDRFTLGIAGPAGWETALLDAARLVRSERVSAQEARALFESGRQQLEQRRESVLAEQKLLERRLATTEAERDRLADRLGATEAGRGRLLAEATAAKTHREWLEGQLARYNAERDRLVGEVAVVAAARAQTEGELISAAADRDDLRGRLYVATRELEEVRGQLTSAAADRDDLRGHLFVAQTERDELRAAVKGRRSAKGESQVPVPLDPQVGAAGPAPGRGVELHMPVPRAIAYRFRRRARQTKLLVDRARHRLLPEAALGLLWHNPLFDADWYLRTYDDVRGSGQSPERHYRRLGVKEGRNPNAMFDTAWYLAQNPDVAATGMNPLDHFYLHGAAEGRDPSPRFDTTWYLSVYRDIAQSGRNPLHHYLRYGRSEGRSPGPFDEQGGLGIVAAPDTAPVAVPIAGATSTNGRSSTHLKPHVSKRLAARLSDLVASDGRVLVVSGGSTELLALGGRQSCEFPVWLAGARPPELLRSGISLVAQLEAQRAAEAGLLITPHDVDGWLTGHPALARHLTERFAQVVYDEGGAAWDLTRVLPLAEAPRGRAVHEIVAEFRERWGRDPAILDWIGAVPADLADGCAVFAPDVPAGAGLPYLDQSIDLVVVDASDAPGLAEARRVASGGVLVVNGPRTGAGVDVEWRSEAPLARPSSVSIVIPNFNGLPLLRGCLRSLSETMAPGWDVEVIVVDDASTDGSADRVAELVGRHPFARLLRNDSNSGFLASASRGAGEAKGEFLVFLNNDTVALPRWLESLIRPFRAHPDAGVVGGRLLYPDGRLQEAGGIVFRDGSAAKFGYGELDVDGPGYTFQRDVDYVSGALLATPRALFEQLGGLDPVYGFGYYEDTDYCFLARQAGRRVLYQPESVIVHIEGGTAGIDLSTGAKRHQVANQAVFRDRWQEVLRDYPERPAVMTSETLLTAVMRESAISS